MSGLSLARGPALAVGTVVTAAGLYFMYKAHTFPPFSNFTQGNAPRDGNFFFGVFGANGWTGLFTAVVGGVLLFGAAEHHLAKLFSLICGCALGAAAVIAVISGNVLGMAAANGWTELGWGVCAAILLLNSLAPRRRHEVVAESVATPAAPVATPQRTVPVEERTALAEERTVPAEERTVPAEERTVLAEQPTVPAEGHRTVADERTAEPVDEPPAAPPAA
ncbi:MAG: hypothetical protein ACRDMJ_07645 [Solirubrobacteraceae bacterium]